MVERTYYNFTSPIGRLVSGSPSRYRRTNQQGEQLVYKSGFNVGEPKRDYSIGVAYRKDQADVPAFIRQLHEYDAKEWPDFFDADLNCNYRDFADKIIDGDSTEMNKARKRPCDNENYKGCWVVWYSSDREPACVTAGAASLIDAKEIKTGYYVRVKGSTCRNTGESPGMYRNLESVELSGYGPEITNRPDHRQAFAESKPAAIPEGMSAVPVSDGDIPVADRHSQADAPPPPDPPGEAGTKVMYKGVAYEKSDLLRRGWTEAQVSALPAA